MSTRHHTEWLSLLEVSGPFLSMPVLLRVFPQGLELDESESERRRELSRAYEEWLDNQRGHQPETAIHRAWVRYVLTQTLEFPDKVIGEGQSIPQDLKADVAEQNEMLRPDVAILDQDDSRPRLLIQSYPLEQALDKSLPDHHWKASPGMRMMELLHATNVPLGLITNGEQWMLVYAPRGETTAFVSWYANLWFEEHITLRAFRSLLGAYRFFGVADEETLAAMLAQSAEEQQEVTDQLGYQVRQAVEVLIQAMDRVDQQSERNLLANATETKLYEAALTVMMRLVFLFSAEERGLFPLDDPFYSDYYAASTLRAQLREAAGQFGEEVIERRTDAWCRLLATFRVIYGGVEHERLRLPPYGGSLFDPDRFPFLEGRNPGTTWKDAPADPLPIDNRTVLHLLEALQMLQVKVPGGGSAEARRLSFRALDIEQIGYVYEGLLDHTAKHAETVVLGLTGTKDKEPEIPLPELEAHQAEGEDVLLEFLKDQTGRSTNALRNALNAEADIQKAQLLRVSCANDGRLYERVLPFAELIREDAFGQPIVIMPGSVYVAAGEERRRTGTHYTPRSLTEPIVQHTLEPQVYDGPAEGKPQDKWKLHSPAHLLNLKICDMAMGSGAFLVQACRYLSERLVEAWEDREENLRGRHGKEHPIMITPEGELTDDLNEAIPADLIIQDELHLISGPLGTLVGLYETAIEQLSSWEVDGKAVRPKVIASTATIRHAESQVYSLYLRRVNIFPPPGIDIQDNFFSRQREPSEENPGRLYLGICAPGIRTKMVIIRVYVAYMAAAQQLFEKYGKAVDPYMTLVGYFNAMRELGGTRRTVEDSVRSRLRRMPARGLSKRFINPFNLEELTSRKSASDIPRILDRLEIQFEPGEDSVGKGQNRPLDVLLATNMISVGVDVNRLGLMVVAGQPKTTSEYIQATSRVGRHHPGIVCVVYNWARPRDLSHYERFEHYHATLYQHVEALSVTPFSPRARDRGLTGVLVSLIRLPGEEFNKNIEAGSVERDHIFPQTAIEAISQRAMLIEGSNEIGTEVKQELEERLDEWLSKAQQVSGGGGQLGYRREKGTVTNLLEDASGRQWTHFTCLNSLRDVEPNVGLVLDNFGMDRGPAPGDPTVEEGGGEA